MILFLFGEDAFRSREKLFALKGAYLAKNASSGLIELACDTLANPEVAIADAARSEGLFASKKLLVIERLIESTGSGWQKTKSALPEILSAAQTDPNRVMIFWEASAPKKTQPIFKFLIEYANKQQDFELLTGTRLEQWIAHRARLIDAKTNIEKRAAMLLAAEMAGDLFALENELRVLADVCEDFCIREADVRVRLKQSVKALVFEALEALSSGNRAKAATLFEDQLKKGENPLYLLSMCAWQWRNLLRVAEAFGEGKRDVIALSRELKLQPFVIRKTMGNIAGFSVERLKKGFALLADLDVCAKTGRIDPAMALDMFAMKA